MVPSQKRKKIEIDENPVNKSSDIIGMFPTVMIAPNDHAIIMEGSEARRKFIDSIISQIDKTYLLHLLDYNKALKQRNRLLKQYPLPLGQLQGWSEIFCVHGQELTLQRKAYMA